MLPSKIPSDEGTWRRLKVLHFPYKFTFEKPTLDNEKKADATIIKRIPELVESFLTMLIHYHQRLTKISNGILAIPDDVKKETKKYRFATDIFEAFKTDCIQIIPKHIENPYFSLDELFIFFSKWLITEGSNSNKGPSKRNFRKKYDT